MPPFNNIESRVSVLESRMTSVETSQMAIASDVREIRDAILNAKGGWKMVLLFGTAGAAIGATVMKLLPYVIR